MAIKDLVSAGTNFRVALANGFLISGYLFSGSSSWYWVSWSLWARRMRTSGSWYDRVSNHFRLVGSPFIRKRIKRITTRTFRIKKIVELYPQPRFRPPYILVCVIHKFQSILYHIFCMIPFSPIYVFQACFHLYQLQIVSGSPVRSGFSAKFRRTATATGCLLWQDPK